MSTITVPDVPTIFDDEPPAVVAVRAEPAPAAVRPLPSRLGDTLFRSTRLAPLWLVVRVWLGYQWFQAGWEKLHAPAGAGWFGDAPALAGFGHGVDAIWDNRAQAFGHPGVHYGWFVNVMHFITDHGWFFGPVVVFSELLIGLGLITGTLTRWAAFAAIGLNLMYVMGGSAGVNGTFLALAALLIAAWRVAGHLGGDRLIHARIQSR
jgi:thiosulfate dehydrogenase [quinone] large subunit